MRKSGSAATKKAAITINEEYTSRNKHQQGFPYKVSCNATTEGQAQIIKFKYTGLLGGEKKDKVFAAEEVGSEKVGVVFTFS